MHAYVAAADDGRRGCDVIHASRPPAGPHIGFATTSQAPTNRCTTEPHRDVIPQDQTSPESDDACHAAIRSVPSKVAASGLDLALMVFKHTEGAERAYSDVLGRAGAAPWAQEVAFVEHHRHDRIVVRGEFAGRYVDADDSEEFLGRKTVEGALTGAVAGALFGPPGFAAGLVGGAVAGSVSEEASGPRLRSAFFDEVRNDVPEGSSAVMLLAAPEHVDAMVEALEGHDGALVRRTLTPDAARALEDAVAASPPAAEPPTD